MTFLNKKKNKQTKKKVDINEVDINECRQGIVGMCAYLDFLYEVKINKYGPPRDSVLEWSEKKSKEIGLEEAERTAEALLALLTCCKTGGEMSKKEKEINEWIEVKREKAEALEMVVLAFKAWHDFVPAETVPLNVFMMDYFLKAPRDASISNEAAYLVKNEFKLGEFLPDFNNFALLDKIPMLIKPKSMHGGMNA